MLEDAAGRAELQRLGARSLPVLSRGDEFVFAQNLFDEHSNLTSCDVHENESVPAVNGFGGRQS